MTVLVLLPHRYAANPNGRTPLEVLTVGVCGAPVAHYRPFGRMVCKPSGRLLRHRETIGFCPLQVANVANIGQYETVTAFFGGFFGGGCGLCHRETFAFSGVGVAFADIVRPLRPFCGWWSALFAIVRLPRSLRLR